MLTSKRDVLKLDSMSKSKMRKSPFEAVPKRNKVPSAFQREGTIQTSDDDFYLEIDSAFVSKKTKSKKLSTFGAVVKNSVVRVHQRLRRSKEYEPFFLSDENMGIDQCSESVLHQSFLTPKERGRHRREFREELAKGYESMCIAVWGIAEGGSNPDNIFVWRVPVIRRSSVHGGKIHFVKFISKLKLNILTNTSRGNCESYPRMQECCSQAHIKRDCSAFQPHY